jgi:hypothetical protein
MAMRVESSVTSLSWIPSEVVTGLTRLSFASGLSHRGPPRAQLDDLNRMHEDDAFRFANVLHAWAEFDDNRVAASGQDGGVRMGSTTVQIGPLDATFAGLPCLIWCRHLRSATAGCGSPRPPVDAPRSGCRGGAQLAVAAIEHKGGTTYWARVTLNDATLAYLPDHAVTGATTERCERATVSPGAIRTPRPDDPRRSGRHSNGTQTCITHRGPEDTMNRNTSPQDSPPHASLMQHRAALIGPTPAPVKGFDNGEGLDNGNV